MKNQTCCICDPKLPLNPHVCYRHKAEGMRLARNEGTYYSEAAGSLYLEALKKQEASL
jgi:hypothetical protein